jgi:hypothetical protein
MVTMVAMPGDLQPECSADRPVTGLCQSHIKSIRELRNKIGELVFFFVKERQRLYA